MEEWGNARANAYYEAKLPRDYPKPRENDPVRVVEKFIREKYEQKRFIADSIPPPMNGAPVAAEPEPVKEVRRTAPATKPVAQVQRPVTTSAPAPAPAAPPKEEANLIDFFDSPAPAPAPVAHVAPAQQFDAFGQGGFNSQPNNFSTASDPFFSGASNNPPQHQPQQQQQQHQQQFQDPFFGGHQAPAPAPAPPAPPKASADAILSLYSTGPSHHQHGGIDCLQTD